MDITESKIKLKSYCVENGYENPSYEKISKVKEGVRKFYKVRVSVDGLITTEGEGVSKRIAEYKAAINALNDLNVIKNEKNKELNNKENNNNNESNLEVNEEKKSEIKTENNDQELVNGKSEKIDEVANEKTIDSLK